MYTKNNRLFKIIMSESAHPYNPEAKMRETHSEGRRPTEVPLGTGNPQPMGTDVVLQLLHQKKKKKNLKIDVVQRGLGVSHPALVNLNGGRV